MLPAIHGGVIGGFMEVSAAIYLMMSQDTFRMPKIVDFSSITCVRDWTVKPTQSVT